MQRTYVRQQSNDSQAVTSKHKILECSALSNIQLTHVRSNRNIISSSRKWLMTKEIESEREGRERCCINAECQRNHRGSGYIRGYFLQKNAESSS
ncbi:hypothetical protein BRADI_3g17896v3 [Brachypodium distachyon]|uniref:Uncharacterized protein n=1 Tax=Brachypodium distachyon TaxID=15368 RepID=A0A2K2CXW6_BRADI|nr:hypothetical protein BRADI_3g17896v3 [Brachypodium distachyon]